MKVIQSHGLNIAYTDQGQGDLVILAHCSSASHRAWLPLISQLKKNYRVVAPDLIAYGRSDPWPQNQPFDPFADVYVIEQLMKEADRPVHLVGHSYGGAMVLEAARRNAACVKSLSLIEPVAFHLLRQIEPQDAWQRIAALSKKVNALHGTGKHHQAAAAYMIFWIGHWRWWLMPNKRKRGIVETIAKVAHEFAAMHQVETPLEQYAEIDVPVKLLAGERTRREARDVVDVLDQAFGNADLQVISGAGHMSVFTHTQFVNQSILEHILDIDEKG